MAAFGRLRSLLVRRYVVACAAAACLLVVVTGAASGSAPLGLSSGVSGSGAGLRLAAGGSGPGSIAPGASGKAGITYGQVAAHSRDTVITDPQTVISDDVGGSFQWPWFAAGTQPTPPGSVTFDGRAVVHLNTPTLGDGYWLYSELSPRSPQGQWVKWRFLWSIDRVTGYLFNDWIAIASIQDQTGGGLHFIPDVGVTPVGNGLKFAASVNVDGQSAPLYTGLGAPIVANQTYDIELWSKVDASTIATKLIVDGNTLWDYSQPNVGQATPLGARWAVFGFDGTNATSTAPPTMAYDDLRFVVGASPPSSGPVPGAPPPEATYGPCDKGSRWQNVESVQAACRARANDPVTLSTGAVSSSMTDASMGSIGEQFKFERSYTSLDTNTGELGVGWTDNYSDKLTVNGNVALWRSGSGAQVLFTQQADGTWKAPPWTSVTLTKRRQLRSHNAEPDALPLRLAGPTHRSQRPKRPRRHADVQRARSARHADGLLRAHGDV
jgi:hypothetical protein